MSEQEILKLSYSQGHAGECEALQLTKPPTEFDKGK